MKQLSNSVLSLVLAPVVASAEVAARADSVTLAENGEARADIVIAEKASVAAQFGALDLQWHLKRITGADFEIIRDNTPKRRTEIRVGTTLRSHCKPDATWKQRFTVDIGDDAVELNGWDGPSGKYKEVTLEFPPYAAPCGTNWPTCYTEQGSMYAVYDFLEQQCGVKWSNLTRYGTFIPSKPTLKIANGHREAEPFMMYRGGTFDLEWGDDTSPMWSYFPQSSNFIAWCSTAFPGGKKDIRTYDRLWLLRNRTGGELRPACHSFGWLYARYWDEKSKDFIEKRPDFFAKGYPGRPPQPCFSNPEVIKIIVEHARDYFDHGGGRWGKDTYCLEPEDNSSFCTCDNCKCDFEPERGSEAAQHSTYWFKFVNKVAAEVRKTHPDKLITTLAYATHEGVPTDLKVENNVVVYSCLSANRSYAGNPGYLRQEARLREWHDSQPQVNLALWLYNCFPLLNALWGRYNCFPGFFAHEAARQYRVFDELGVRGGVFHCGFNGEVANYMQLKLMFNPKLGADELLDDYFRVYGNAAPAMREFYDLVEKRYNDPDARPKSGGSGQFISWGCLGTPDLMAKLENCMKQAESAAKTEQERKLVELFKLDVWDWMKSGFDVYSSRATTPVPKWTAKRIPAGADGDPDKVDWTKLEPWTGQMYRSGCADRAPSEASVRMAHDGKWMYVELGERTEVSKLVRRPLICPYDTWEMLFARQCAKPYRYYITGIDSRGAAYSHGEISTRSSVSAEELGTPLFGGVCRADCSAKDRWTVRWALPLDNMLDKPISPGDHFFMNAVRVVNPALCKMDTFGIYSLVSHANVHTPDRLGEVELE